MTIMHTGMTIVMEQAMVHPMVPSRSSITFTTKSITFLVEVVVEVVTVHLEALCVSLILPNSES